MTAYATVEDFEGYLNPDPDEEAVPVPPGATRLLRDASEVLDELLIGAMYATDADGMPTDPDVVDALKRATCAQARYTSELGDETGAKGQYASWSTGGVSVTRAFATAGSNQLNRVAPQAVLILRTEGLLPSYVVRW